MSSRVEEVIRDSMALLSNGQVSEAIAKLDDLKVQGLEGWSPRETRAWYQARAAAATVADELAEASVLLEQAAKVYPDDPGPWLSSATLAEQTGNYERCTMLLGKARSARELRNQPEWIEVLERMEARIAEKTSRPG